MKWIIYWSHNDELAAEKVSGNITGLVAIVYPLCECNKFQSMQNREQWERERQKKDTTVHTCSEHVQTKNNIQLMIIYTS